MKTETFGNADLVFPCGRKAKMNKKTPFLHENVYTCGRGLIDIDTKCKVCYVKFIHLFG